MGTSSIYTGPKRSPLLPSDFIDDKNPSDEFESPNSESGDEKPNDEGERSREGKESLVTNSQLAWSGAKKLMSKYASGSSNNYKSAISHYVKAKGGSKAASRVAATGVKTLINVGRLFGSISTKGLKESLSSEFTDLDGKSINEILAIIINYVNPAPVTKEEAVSRKALITTLEEFYNEIDGESGDFSLFDSLTKDSINLIIPKYIEAYIYELLISDLGSRVEVNSKSSSEAITKEKEIKDYINSKVETALKNEDFTKINLNSNNINMIILDLFQQCYKVMEDMI